MYIYVPVYKLFALYYAQYVAICLNKSLESFLLCFSIVVLFIQFKF